MDFPFPVHFAWVPVDLLHKQKPMVIHAEWFDDLKEDIHENGLASPLLVSNVAEPLVKPVPMRVLTGMNRLRCLIQLGWERAPCIVVGPLPEGVEGRPLKDLEEAQSLLGDGIIGYANWQTSLRINSALLPEHGKYPETKTRYRIEDYTGG